MNYRAMAEDVIRFADAHDLDRFTVLGHSMGGRTAMYVACKYPDRVNGCISIDAAPVDESQKPDFMKDVRNILAFMNDISANHSNISREDALKLAESKFEDRAYIK